MAMEVSKNSYVSIIRSLTSVKGTLVNWTWYDNLYFTLFSGQEVALWVKDNFKKELVKLQSYKSKCYKEALEEVFLKLDVLMQAPAGQRRLMEL